MTEKECIDFADAFKALKPIAALDADLDSMLIETKYNAELCLWLKTVTAFANTALKNDIDFNYKWFLDYCTK